MHHLASFECTAYELQQETHQSQTAFSPNKYILIRAAKSAFSLRVLILEYEGMIFISTVFNN